MLLSIAALIAILAFVLMILSIYWESYIFAILDGGLFFSSGIMFNQIEIPYQLMNNTTVVTGTQTLSYPSVSYIFVGFGILMIVYAVFHVMEYLHRKKYGEDLW